MTGPGNGGRQLHFNAFLMGSGHHEAAWRLPENDPDADFRLAHWRRLARLAERGRFDSVFLADGPALWHSGEYRPPGALEPAILLTALAVATSHVGLIATASTTYRSGSTPAPPTGSTSCRRSCRPASRSSSTM